MVVSMQTLAQRIKALRTAQGCTQSCLAKNVGISLRSLQTIESAQSDIRLSTLSNIAEYFSIEPYQLLTPLVTESVASEFSAGDQQDKHFTAYCPLDHWPVAIEVCRPDGLVKYLNAKAATLKGYPRSEIIDKMYAWDFLADKSEIADIKKYFKFLMEHRIKPTPYISANRRKNGEEFKIRVNWSYIFDDKNNVSGFFSTLHEFDGNETC